MSELATLKLSEIKENPVALRQVNRESESYLGLVDSIRNVGVMNPINVRRRTDLDTGEIFFELVDGLHRFSASRDAGKVEVPVHILDLGDAQVLEAQIIGNIHRVETKPVEYSQQLRRILAANPMMTEAELAQKLGKSPAWIAARLGLNKITNEKVKELIDEGRITLTNAYQLAKLPEAEQLDYLEKAQVETPDAFTSAVNSRVKEIKESKRAGKDVAPATFVPPVFLQKLTAIKEASEDGAFASSLVESEGVASTTDAFLLALRWVLHQDSASIAAGKAKWEAERQAKEEARQRRAEEKAAKKEAEAREATEEAIAAEDD